MEILVLSREEMAQAISMKEAIEANKEAYRLHSENKSDVPLRYNLNIGKHEGQSLYMPGYVEDANALGIKIVSVFPKNIEKGLTSVPATMVLLNSQTGEVSCLMDGTFLTQLRTGAAAGAATDVLAKKTCDIFALIGTGGQAEAQLEAVLTVRQLKLVKVYDVSFERAEAFASEMALKYADKFSVQIQAVKSSNEAVDQADIITCVTTSKTPVIDGHYLKKGCHINGVGSYTEEMSEIDAYTVIHADRLFVDTRQGALKEAGDLIKPLREGLIDENRIDGELGEVISNVVVGRKNDMEITVFKTTGSAVQDVVTAQRIYEAAIKNKNGMSIQF